MSTKACAGSIGSSTGMRAVRTCASAVGNVANDVSRADAGFETDENAVTLLSPGGEVEELPLLSKAEVAQRLLDRIEKLRLERS